MSNFHEVYWAGFLAGLTFGAIIYTICKIAVA